MNNVILLQSYSSPSPLSADHGVLEVLQKQYPNMKIVFEKTPNIFVFGIRKILKYALKSNLISKKGDVIFGWGGDLCLYSWLFGKMLRKKRLYFSQNLIIRSDGKHDGVKNRIRYLLYKKALHSKNFMTTVNAPQLIDFYAEMFSCDKDRFAITYDNRATDLEEQNERAENVGEPYVFAGGVAGRDVDTFVKVVKLLPQIKFKCVFPKSMLILGMEDLKNLEVFSDIPEKEFYRIMNGATICCIPLKSKAPCGLYTMQHAVLTGLPIVSTDTWSMRTIIPDDNCGYLLPMRDTKAMAEKVRLLMNNEDLRNTVIANAKKNFSKFEPHNVGKQLCNAIDDFIKKESGTFDNKNRLMSTPTNESK